MASKGYAEIGMRKYEWATRIGPHLDLVSPRSPSFARSSSPPTSAAVELPAVLNGWYLRYLERIGMKILIAAPPKTGNSWLKCLFSAIYDLEWLTAERVPAGTDLEEFRAWVETGGFPENSVFHHHYDCSPAFCDVSNAEQVQLPAGYEVEWGGQFENMARAIKRLSLIVPLTIAAIYLLLFMLFDSARQATMIVTVLPLAAIGGVFGLIVSGEYLSVPAAVGFINLWGIAVLNGVVLVSYIRNLRQSGIEQRRAIMDGATLRFRPVMMTATVAALGLVPFLFATGPGAEVQRPLAIVVIGGLITSTLLTLVVVPALYRFFDDLPPAGAVSPEEGQVAAGAV